MDDEHNKRDQQQQKVSFSLDSNEDTDYYDEESSTATEQKQQQKHHNYRQHQRHENEDEDDDDEEEELDGTETNSSLDEQMCISPPVPRTLLKNKTKKKKSVYYSNNNNSADESRSNDHSLSLGITPINEANENEHQQQHQQTSISANNSSSNLSGSSKPNPGYIKINNKRRDSNEIIRPNNLNQQHQQHNQSPQLNTKQHHHSEPIDPFEREESFKKIGASLKLALSNKQECIAPPCTPVPAVPDSMDAAAKQQHQQSPFFNTKVAAARTMISAAATTPFQSAVNKLQPSNELKKQMAENVWKNMFDFFVFYDNRAKNDAEIEARLKEKRSIIPMTIHDIMQTNFQSITENMEATIKSNVRTPHDFSKINEFKSYVDQLCYLYCLVEDILNRVGYIESLYPSRHKLAEDQPDYKNAEFEGIVHTLLLWYKIMTDLMNKSDMLGSFLGFIKKNNDCSADWAWFDQRLKYSRTEYEKVQDWLNKSVANLQQPPLYGSLPFFGKHKENNASSAIDAHLLSVYMDNNLKILKQSPTKHERQVSFELKASKSSVDLLYNTLNKSSSVMETLNSVSESANTRNNENSSSAVIDLTSMLPNSAGASQVEQSPSSSKDTSTEESGASGDGGGGGGTGVINLYDIAAQILTNVDKTNGGRESLSEDHLKPAKLHHLQSYLSRSSSYISSDSYSFNSPNVSLTSSTNEINSGTASTKQPPKVNFNLNSNNEDDNDRTEADKTGLLRGGEHNSLDTIRMEDIVQSRKNSITAGYSESVRNREQYFDEFLHKRLRKFGLTKTCDDIRAVLKDALPHTLQALQIDYCERPMLNSNSHSSSSSSAGGGGGHDQHFYYHMMPLHKKCREYMGQFKVDDEAKTYGVSSSWFKKLQLPSPRPLYMYLNSVILDLMHACIKKQISSKQGMKEQSNFKFSLLSIEVLTHECRECIEQAILVRQFYYHMAFSVYVSSELDIQGALEIDLMRFDEDLKRIIDIYLTFITDWVHDLVANMATFKALEVLNDEWKFCKNNLYFVTASEDMYAIRFCTMCTLVNDSLTQALNDLETKHQIPLMDYIMNEESMLDAIIDNYDSLTSESGSNLCAAKTASESARKEESSSLTGSEQQESNNQQQLYQRSIEQDMKFDVNLKCNEFKEEINQLRKRSMKALEFFSSLICDLELAAKYNVTRTVKEVLDELKATNHVLVSFLNPELQMSYLLPTTPSAAANSSSSFETMATVNKTCTKNAENQKPSFMIFVPHEFSKDKTQIVRLLFLISAKDDLEINLASNNNDSSDVFGSSSSSSNHAKSSKFDAIKSNEVVRRFSSSNSFMELNDRNRDTMLHRLSKIANLKNPLSADHRDHHESSTSPGSTNLTNPFIFTQPPYSDGYLLFIQLPRNLDEHLIWDGHVTNLHASMPVRRSLYQHRSSSENLTKASIILVVPRQSILSDMRIELKKKLKGTISLSKEKTSFHPNIECAIDELKNDIIKLRDDTVKCIRSIENLKTTSYNYNYNNELSLQQKFSVEQRYLSEIWRVSYNFGIELQNECFKFMTQDRAELYSKGLAEFCIMWAGYIVDKTERGKGRTVQPWAAKKGIQLMDLAWQNSRSLNDEQFSKLRSAIESCLLHVIGGRSHSGHSRHLSADEQQHESHLRSCLSMYSNLRQQHSSSSSGGGMNHQLSAPQMHHSMSSQSIEMKEKKIVKQQPPSKRFDAACKLEDYKRENNLFEKRLIGKIINQQPVQNLITAKEVNFRWQLGLKIGSGQFGDVYSCVNLDTGEPMAMKEIRFRSNDAQTILGIANEINNLQGVEHENLVKFYGAELHRKEMLLFMEFCGDQSTLDRISREASGLPEKIVRNYTKSLLHAVETLHENKIMHRDIKGQNIFLKATDPKHPDKIVLKLGDFGCSIKFKDPIGPTNKHAKATGFMGTFHFMAPEVMISGGDINAEYTISADIWSLGCVVIEMFTGKRPWHPLAEQQIMYKVHLENTAKKPPYPNNISSEALDFLDRCLEFEPSARYTADQLLDQHPFVKVESNE